jgi:hypothetical protein
MPKLRPLTIEIIFKDMSYKQTGLTLRRAGEVINEKIKDIYGLDVNVSTQLVYNLKMGKEISPIVRQMIKVYDDAV